LSSPVVQGHYTSQFQQTNPAAGALRGFASLSPKANRAIFGLASPREMKLLLALLVVCFACSLAVPTPPRVNVDRQQLLSQAVPATSFLEAAPTVPTIAGMPLEAAMPGQAAPPMYDPLLIGMMGFFPFLGNFPGLYKPFFFPYGCASLPCPPASEVLRRSPPQKFDASVASRAV